MNRARAKGLWKRWRWVPIVTLFFAAWEALERTTFVFRACNGGGTCNCDPPAWSLSGHAVSSAILIALAAVLLLLQILRSAFGYDEKGSGE
jgi:hypothetical protein